MLVKQEQVSPCEVELEIQVDSEKVAKAIAETYKEFGKHTMVSGFRKGKAPRALVERMVDKEKVREFVVDKLLEDAYEDAIKESGLEPFAAAQVDVIQFELDDLEKPFLAKAIVPLAPKTELGDYVGLSFERKLRVVTDEDVESAIREHVVRQAPMIDVTDRPVQAGDHLTIHLGAIGETLMEREIVVEQLLPDFQAGVIGMSIGEAKTITVSYPEGFADDELSGQTKAFMVEIDGIKEQPIPELTDEWVREYFAGPAEPDTEPDPKQIDTVEKFRAESRRRLEASAQIVADYGLKKDVMDAVIANSKVDFPEALIQIQVRGYFRDLESQLKGRNAGFEEYLQYKGITFEQWEAEARQRAKDTLTKGLALRAIVEKESISVSDEDVETEMQRMAAERHVPVETVRAMLSRENMLDELKDEMLDKKVLQFLINASNTRTVEVQNETE